MIDVGHVDALFVRSLLGELARAELVVAAEHERGVASTRPEVVIEASLVVPVAKLQVECRDRREDQPRVAVATSERQGAATLRSTIPVCEALLSRGVTLALAHLASRTIEGDLQQAAGIGQAQVDLAAHAVASGSARVAFDDPARETSEPNWDAARIEVDLVDEVRVDDRGPGCDVKQRRYTHAVEVVAGVARRGASHHDVRQEARDLRGARQRLHHSKGIAAGAR